MKTKEKLPLKAIEKAAEIIKSGGVVVFPTDTVYGLGCKWDDKAATSRIKKIKGSSKSFPFLVSNLKQVRQLAKVNKAAQDLINKHWPGALTLILESKNSKERIGLRMPDSAIVKHLINLVGAPIVGTSANLHGKPPASKLKDLEKTIASKVDFIIEGKCLKKMQSTVIDTTKSPPKILRYGALLQVKDTQKILSIDTTGPDVKVELCDSITKKRTVLVKKQIQGSQTLLPLIANILQKNKIQKTAISKILVNTGPGSFTGTRVGVAVANALGFALGIPVNGKIDKQAIPKYARSKFD